MSMACQDVRVLSQMICESSFWARLPLSVETFSDRPDAVTVITPLPLWCLRVRAGFLPGHTDPWCGTIIYSGTIQMFIGQDLRGHVPLQSSVLRP